MLNSLINLDLKREDLELKTRIYGNLQTIRNSLDAQFGQFIEYCSFSTTLSDTEVECIFFEDSNYSIDRLSDVLETLTICRYVFISTGFKTKFKNIIQTFANSDYYLEHEGAFFSLFYKRQLIVQKNTTCLHSSEFNEDFLFSGIPRVDKIFLRKAAKSGGVFRTPAIEFLKVKRFDIAAKCLYGRLWILGWAEN